jgi:hypothetical protein
MSTSQKCLGFLENARARVDELFDMVEHPDPDPEAALAFLELVQDAQSQLDQALHAALFPMLSGRSAAEIDDQPGWLKAGE